MSKQTITEFLEARISEDESREAGRYRHRDDLLPWGCTVTTGGFDPEYVKINHADGESVKIPVAEFRERYTEPAPDIRMLAECAAKRAIIAAHPIVDDVVEVSTRVKWGFACETCFSYGDVVEDNGYCDTLRALAAVYADHSDYQQEWAL